MLLQADGVIFSLFEGVARVMPRLSHMPKASQLQVPAGSIMHNALQHSMSSSIKLA